MRGTSSEALRELSRARNVVLTTHINPDGDALGSMLALYMFLRQRGTRVQMWLDDDLPGMYAFLPELDKIVRPPAACVQGELIVVLRCQRSWTHWRGLDAFPRSQPEY
jgi:phosphoesterase RecJ-like protein